MLQKGTFHIISFSLVRAFYMPWMSLLSHISLFYIQDIFWVFQHILRKTQGDHMVEVLCLPAVPCISYKSASLEASHFLFSRSVHLQYFVWSAYLFWKMLTISQKMLTIRLKANNSYKILHFLLLLKNTIFFCTQTQICVPVCNIIGKISIQMNT